MIAGIDFDTRCVHVVFLDEDSNQGRYVPCPIASKGGSFEAARNVRESMKFAIWDAQKGVTARTLRDGWESVWLVGLEDAFHRSHRTKIAQARIQGAILSSIPRGVCVVPIPAGEWKKETVGRGDASKEDVRAWGTCEVRGVQFEEGWPQDAYDAYAIARAVRTMNDRGVARAVATGTAG